MASYKCSANRENASMSTTDWSTLNPGTNESLLPVKPNQRLVRLIRRAGRALGLYALCVRVFRPQTSTLDNEKLDRGEWDGIASLVKSLKQRGIQVQESNGRILPSGAIMHDRGAVVPMLVVSPQSEWGVVQTLKLLKDANLYDR